MKLKLFCTCFIIFILLFLVNSNLSPTNDLPTTNPSKNIKQTDKAHINHKNKNYLIQIECITRCGECLYVKDKVSCKVICVNCHFDCNNKNITDKKKCKKIYVQKRLV